MIDMWRWFLTSASITNDKIVVACQEGLGGDRARIAVVHSIVDLDPAALEHLDVIAERGEARGEYPVQITLFAHHARVPLNPIVALQTLIRICRATDHECLIEDGGLDPYSMFRVSPSGKVEAIDLDADRFDADESYVVRQVREIAPSVLTGAA